MLIKCFQMQVSVIVFGIRKEKDHLLVRVDPFTPGTLRCANHEVICREGIEDSLSCSFRMFNRLPVLRNIMKISPVLELCIRDSHLYFALRDT